MLGSLEASIVAGVFLYHEKIVAFGHEVA